MLIAISAYLAELSVLLITIGSIRDADLDLAREPSETNREAGALEIPEAARVAAANDVVQGTAIDWVAESDAAGVAAQAALSVRASAVALAELGRSATDIAAQIFVATASDGDSVAAARARRLVATVDATARATRSKSSPRRAP